MHLLSLFTFAVLASETIISPVPVDAIIHDKTIERPAMHFYQFISDTPIVPGDATPSAETVSSLTPTSAITPTPAPVVSPAGYQSELIKQIQQEKRRATKTNITIAVLGDSMVDTLGPEVPDLADTLKSVYTNIKPTILNYGVGATNIEYGKERLTSDYTYLDHHVPALVNMHPDIIVVESFGYNPYSFDEGALDKHWLALASIVDIIKKFLPGTRIIIAATIAPNAKVFADGTPGLSFSAQAKWEHVNVVKKYLESTIKFAHSQKLPLADAYTPSLLPDGNGNPIYINGGDNIHPSDTGRKLFAAKVTETIISEKMLE